VTTDALLAAGDAALSAVSLGFVLAAYRAIRRKDIPAHRRRMLVAVVASFGFLVLFVIRFATFGFAPFEGTGAARAAYLAVLFSHEPLAVVAVPLVLAAAILGLRGAVRSHREVAPLALWVWLFVLITGLVLYAVLYVG